MQLYKNNARALLLRIFSIDKDSGLYLYFRIRHSLTHLRPVILYADWSISRLQSWTCSSLPTVAVFVKLTQSIVIEIQRQSADLYKVQLCNRQFFIVSTAVYVVKVYECHPLGIDNSGWLQHACSVRGIERNQLFEFLSAF